MVGRERWRLSDHKEGAHGREVELLSGGTQQEERARAQTRGETASWWITVAFQFHVEAAHSNVLMNTKYEDVQLDPRCVQQKSSRSPTEVQQNTAAESAMRHFTCTVLRQKTRKLFLAKSTLPFI